MFGKIKSSRPIVSVLLLLLAGGLWAAVDSSASYLVPQTALDGSRLPQFETPLPVFGPGYNAAFPRVDARKLPYLTVKMKEVDQQVLPATMNFGATKVWAYEIWDSVTGKLLAPAHWPAVTIEATRHRPITAKHENELPTFPTGLVQGLITTDQTIHWAAPLTSPGANPCYENPSGGTDCGKPFDSPVPGVVHLHGAEVPSMFDGVPDAWFTPTGLKGRAYSSLGKPGPGVAVYRYPNDQEPGTLIFHDHTLGATRTNVYSGLLGFYFIRDQKMSLEIFPKARMRLKWLSRIGSSTRKANSIFPTEATRGATQKFESRPLVLTGRHQIQQLIHSGSPSS